MISRNGYVIKKKLVNPELEKLIKNDLIVTPELATDYKIPQSFKVYREDKEFYYLPRYWGLENIDIEPVIKFKYKKKHIANFKFKGILRNHQMDIINTMIDIFYNKKTNKLRSCASSIISVPTGYGKTVLAIYMMCFIKRKTLIFCHTKNLFDQWIERLTDYIDVVKIGVIQGSICKIKNCNVVLCMIQTIINNKIDYTTLLKHFDFAIYDECHHMSAQTFSSVLHIIQPPFSLGLSATPERQDKLEKVYKWSLNEIGYIINGKIDQDVKIQIYKFNKTNDNKYKMLVNRYTKKANISQMMTNLTEIKERNDLIIKIIQKTLNEANNRKIIVLSNRIEHLNKLKDILEILYPGKTSLYIGKMKKDQLKIAEGKQIILASNNIAEEGLDIFALDTILLCSPKSRILQACGRILRRQKHQYENIPLMIDINDMLGLFNAMNKKRMTQYKEKYLQSEKSILEIYKYDNETEFEIKFETKINYQDNKTPIEITDFIDINQNKYMFDSDSD